tara:strand:+ start:221 stop:475 length:255 start_codon:yes stop_codon:yes gene_type:complete
MNTEPDIDWRQDCLNTKARLNKRTIELLTNGATNFSQALILKELKVRWLKMKGLYVKQEDPPNCQSSFNDLNKRIDSEEYLTDG